MFSKFSIENFKSIKDRITLDMNATNITGLEKNLIDLGSNKLLKSISIIGPNASGKSNLLNGFVIMRHLVIDSAKNIQAKELLPIEPFRLNLTSETQPSLFEVELILGNKTFVYGFRADAEKVYHEWLIQKLKTTTKKIFTRENNTFSYDKSWKENKSLERFLRNNALFLSVAAQWNIPLAAEIVEWFMSINTLHGLSFQQYANISINLMEDKETRPLIIELMKKADLGIENMKVEPTKSKQDLVNRVKNEYNKEVSKFLSKKNFYDVLTYHSKYNDGGEKVGDEEFNLSIEESDGTRKFFSMIGAILEAFIKGELVIIDEFDARLHPDLVNEVINLFNSASNKQGQLICVNFNTGVLNNKLLRRDQIYLIEKDHYGSSKLNSMVEYNIRKGQPMEKHYREGRVGGKPTIEDFQAIF